MEKVVGFNECRQCRKAKRPVDKHAWLTGILMVVLPKCPFCVFAYSSTIMLCSKDAITSTTNLHHSQSTILFTVILCFVTLAGIAFNWRGRRTMYAIGIALTGSLLAVYSVLYGGGEFLYYCGVLLIFTGVWLNGSLLYVINRVRNKLTSPVYKIS
jgi:hypothetical protein